MTRWDSGNGMRICFQRRWWCRIYFLFDHLSIFQDPAANAALGIRFNLKQAKHGVNCQSAMGGVSVGGSMETHRQRVNTVFRSKRNYSLQLSSTRAFLSIELYFLSGRTLTVGIPFSRADLSFPFFSVSNPTPFSILSLLCMTNPPFPGSDGFGGRFEPSTTERPSRRRVDR